MRCRECGFSFETQALFCPNCGVRLAVPEAAPLHAPVEPPPAAQPTPWRETVPAPIAAQSAPKVVAESAIAAAAQASGKSSKASLLQPGEIFADRYRVEKFLGQGSLCNSYLCRDIASGNRESVLKIMHPRKASEPGLEDSFLFLADSVSKYDYKGIAKTYEWGKHNGVPYYTMEWISGVPLRMWLLERLTFENRVLPGLGLLRSLIDVFETVHERGCYGCLKPENVFVTLSGPVIMDFGAVGFLSSQEFEFNAYARRYIPYMAPELRQDWSNLIPHSDYFSLGAILYEILVGRAPAPQLRLPSEMSELFGIEADEIILKAMAPKPLDRFGNLEAFRGAVEGLQASLLNSQAAPGTSLEMGSSGEMPVQHVRPEVATDARTIHDPDVSFSTPVSGTPVTAPASESPASESAQPSWTPEPRPVEDNPYSRFEGAEGGKTLILPGRESEAAHAQRKFSHPIVPPLAEKPVETAESPFAAASPEAGNAADARAWESLTGKTPPKAEEKHEPIPAWLWIALALAGCCMVVLSAYFGLLLPH
jgi:serine/threonine protein kinase